MAKNLQTPFKDDIVPKASGSSDLELEGGAKYAGGDIRVNGNDVVTIVGDGELDAWLKDINP